MTITREDIIKRIDDIKILIEEHELNKGKYITYDDYITHTNNLAKSRDLSHIDFHDTDLSNLNLYRFNFNHSNLYNVNLENTNLTRSSFENSTIFKIKATNTNFYLSNLKCTYINASCFVRANFEGAKLISSNVVDSDFTDAIFKRTHLSFTSFDVIKGKIIHVFSCNKHCAYYVDGILTIGCTRDTPKNWLKNKREHIRRASFYNYTKDEIKIYKKFIKLCKKAG